MVLNEFGHFPKYRNPPGSVWALLGLSGIEERKGKGGRHAPKPNLNWVGAGPSLSFPLSSPSFSPTPTTWKGGILLPVGVVLP